MQFIQLYTSLCSTLEKPETAAGSQTSSASVLSINYWDKEQKI